MSQNNPSTIEGLREMIRSKAAETLMNGSQYDYGYVNGWLGALYWSDEIDRATMDQLKNEAKAAFEQASTALNSEPVNS